jgi:hypothetical protein
MLCSIIANGNLHIFQVTAAGDLVHGSHTAGTGAFPFETITNGCDPKVVPTAQIFNNTLRAFAQKTEGDIVWGCRTPRGKVGCQNPREVRVSRGWSRPAPISSTTAVSQGRPERRPDTSMRRPMRHSFNHHA